MAATSLRCGVPHLLRLRALPAVRTLGGQVEPTTAVHAPPKAVQQHAAAASTPWLQAAGVSAACRRRSQRGAASGSGGGSSRRHLHRCTQAAAQDAAGTTGVATDPIHSEPEGGKRWVALRLTAAAPYHCWYRLPCAHQHRTAWASWHYLRRVDTCAAAVPAVLLAHATTGP